MDSREAAERARLAETFLFRGAPPEAVELARTDPRTVRQENGKGGVIYAPHAFRRCLGVVLEGRVQVNKGALIMSVLEPGDLFGAAALFNDRADYATTLTARAPCRVLLLPQALVEELSRIFGQLKDDSLQESLQAMRTINHILERFPSSSTDEKEV